MAWEANLALQLARILVACQDLAARRTAGFVFRRVSAHTGNAAPSQQLPCLAATTRGRSTQVAAVAAATQARSSSQRSSVAALLGAAAAAVLAAEARCEARAGPAKDGVSPEQVEASVRELWLALEEQLHRVEASLPSQVALPSIPEPEVTVGRGGGEVAVVFHLPQALDLPAALNTLRRRLRSPRFRSLEEGTAGASVSEQSSSGREGRARRFVRRSAALGDLEVDVMEPHDPSQPARLEFRGPPTEGGLELMTAVLEAAMSPRRRGPFQDIEDELGPLFEGGGPLGGLPHGLGGALDPFLGHIREFMEEFAQLREEGLWGIGEGGSERGEDDGGWWGPRDTEPTPLRRPKRWDELGGPEVDPGRQLGPPHGGDDGGAARRGGSAAPGLTPEEREAAAKQRKLDAAVKKLQASGAQVFLPGKAQDVDWGILAGYEDQKRAIEDTLLLALLHPEVYNEIAKGTRQHYSPNRPRAVLFEGPPGTGKTTSARVIATQAAVPLVYIPLESIVSKWYGESERMLADMLKACESLPDGCIVFLDELDALATSRATDMHEATRRLLGVLLRHLDGFDTSKRTVVIGATNRKQDLDAALLSRFDTAVTFGLPSEACRVQILGKYARHLSEVELGGLARVTPGMAGRDLRDIAEQAERRWASKIIRGQAAKGALPPLSEYMEAARQRLREQAGMPAH